MSTPSPRFRPWGLALLLALVALAVLRSHVGTQRDGFTIDEPWHVVAGVSYLRSGDYRLNPEHPPLVKLVAGAAQAPGFVLPPFAPLVEKSQERDWVEAAMFFQNDAAAAQQATRRGLWAFHALLLVATSHPRDIDLSALSMPVTKLVGDRDGLATPERVARNRSRLPRQTRWVEVPGANHSQFGDYGFQPGDRFARIPRETQQQALAEEARRLVGEMVPIQGAAGQSHRMAFTIRVPRGVVGGISSFNCCRYQRSKTASRCSVERPGLTNKSSEAMSRMATYCFPGCSCTRNR